MQHALSVIAPALLALVVYPAATGLLNWYLWWDTPAAWDAFAAAYPKRAKWVRILRAINPHFHKLAEVWRDEAAKRSAVPPSVGPLAPSDPVALPLPTPAEPSPVLRAVTVSYRPQPMPPPSDDGNAAAYELARREAASARVFDPLARQTIAPETVASIHHATTLTGRGDSQSGRVELGAAGFVVVLAGIILVGLYVAGCVPVRRFVLDHTDGVPARGPCVPTVQRCAALDGGVYLPVVCSSDHREWPTHPLSPDGEQLTCAVGEGCEVTDAGIARCTSADGGAR